jgi:8-oxo-dGTP pyrophosphatase MutT (NUDIX family)
MPLESGSSSAVIGRNIAELMKAGKPRAQAAAIAYRKAGETGANDMSPQDWRGLLHGLLEFFTEESKEPEHASDVRDPSGAMTEAERAEAGRNAKSRAEMPEGVFLAPAERKYPVKEKRDGEWAYSRNLLLAAAREARMHGHEDLARQADKIRQGMTNDGSAHAAGTIYAAPDGDVLLLRRSSSEANYPGHWALPGGKGEEGETPEQTAQREAIEEMGIAPNGVRKLLDKKATPTGMTFHTFVQPVDEKFVPALNDEHSGYAWAPIGQLPEPMHPAVKSVLSKMAMDGAVRSEGLALDRSPENRIKTEDGHLHVKQNHLSKAAVNPYLGKEIPGYQALGLDPDKVYNLFRHPDELKKAVSTANGLPLLLKHEPSSADDHPRDITVGALGTESKMNGPYLDNSLSIWDGEGIKAVESGAQKELSMGYHYRPDMTPGVYEGKNYDGVMRDLRFNHAALVPEGRAGSDVVVGDSKEEINMATKHVVLSRKAAAAKGALVAFLAPKMAADAKIDLSGVLSGVSAKSWTSDKPKIVAGLTALVKGKLAADANIDGVLSMLDKLDGDEEPDEMPDPNGGMDADGLSPEEEAQYQALCKRRKTGGADVDRIEGAPGVDAEEEKIRAALKGVCDESAIEKMMAARKGGAADEPLDVRGETVSRPAMDAAIAKAVRDAESATMGRLASIREAERAVKPLLGDVTVALDSADAIYAAALTASGVKVDSVHASAYPAMVKILVDAKSTSARPTLAVDNSIASDVAAFEKKHGINQANR